MYRIAGRRGEVRRSGRPSETAVHGGAGVRQGRSTNLKIVLRERMDTCCIDAAYRRTGEQGYGMVGNISVILFRYGWVRWRGVLHCDRGW